MNRKKILLISLIVVTLFLVFNSSFSKYVSNLVNNLILESKHFYFESSILKDNNKTYSVSNWDGVNAYNLDIDVSSKKDEFKKTDVDVEYDIDIECPSSVICSLSKTNSIIYSSSNTDSYIVTVTPIDNFYAGDSVIVKTSVTSTSPYSKTLSATYIIGVENYGFAYNISDEIGSKFLTLNLTNSKPYYEVKQAFDSYQIGDHISLDVYNNLSDIEKSNCVSINVTISFDPNNVLLDLTNNNYINKISETTTNIDGYTYVNGINIDVGANQSEKIIFFKNNINADYSNSNIINVQVNS